MSFLGGTGNGVKKSVGQCWSSEGSEGIISLFSNAIAAHLCWQYSISYFGRRRTRHGAGHNDGLSVQARILFGNSASNFRRPSLDFDHLAGNERHSILVPGLSLQGANDRGRAEYRLIPGERLF